MKDEKTASLQQEEYVFPTYEIKNSFPTVEPTVRIVFHGLLCFFFDGSRGCKVGIHNYTQTPGYPQPHDFNIVVRAIIQGNCKELDRHNIGDSRKHARYAIEVVNPIQDLDGTYVYQTNGPFSRKATNSDPRDWRWVLDFEGPDLYKRRLDKRTDRLIPYLSVNKGIFYTLARTESRFAKYAPGEGFSDLGKIAYIIAADIYLQDSGYVSLKIDGIEKQRLIKQSRITYEIDITNTCLLNNQACKFDPASSDKRQRNDFYAYYRVFEVPADGEEYELICTDIQSDEREIPGICLTTLNKSTDPAPCGGTGSGGTPSIP